MLSHHADNFCSEKVGKVEVQSKGEQDSCRATQIPSSANTELRHEKQPPSHLTNNAHSRRFASTSSPVLDQQSPLCVYEPGKSTALHLAYNCCQTLSLFPSSLPVFRSIHRRLPQVLVSTVLAGLGVIKQTDSRIRGCLGMRVVRRACANCSAAPQCPCNRSVVDSCSLVSCTYGRGEACDLCDRSSASRLLCNKMTIYVIMSSANAKSHFVHLTFAFCCCCIQRILPPNPTHRVKPSLFRKDLRFIGLGKLARDDRHGYVKASFHEL